MCPEFSYSYIGMKQIMKMQFRIMQVWRGMSWLWSSALLPNADDLICAERIGLLFKCLLGSRGSGWTDPSVVCHILHGYHKQIESF